jgi:integrase/recombinase XerD
MLHIYRRHNPDLCDHKERTWRRCSCPLWVDGLLRGRRYHKSLKVRNWEVAAAMAQRLEAEGEEEESKKISDATEEFVKDATARGLKSDSLSKYRRMFRDLNTFAADRGLLFLDELEVAELRAFRETWKNKNYSARKKLESLRTFFRFCHDAGWVDKNAAKLVKSPKVDDPPTLPFTQKEFDDCVKASDNYPDERNRPRILGLLYLLRYSGLRITDAVTLRRDKIKDGMLTLRTAKTGTDVRVPLPPAAVKALNAIPPAEYFFWSGNGLVKSVVGNYGRAMRTLYKLAGVKNGHAHRWRDTFATELLLRGATIEQVAALLGHQSTKVTEKHYSPWVRARQEQLEAVVKSTF